MFPGGLCLLLACIPAAGPAESSPAFGIASSAVDVRLLRSGRAGPQNTIPPERGQDTDILLSAPGAEGNEVPVDGIVCDNLRDTPEDQKDCLHIGLPATFSKYEMDGSVTNPDGTAADPQ